VTRLLTSFCIPFICIAPIETLQADCVVLLHGLARQPGSMKSMQEALVEEGYSVVNIGYKSRSKAIEELAPEAIESSYEQCPEDESVHFVTHSMGGILLRYYLEQEDLSRLGRVVMLAPPNQGSEVVDGIGWLPGFDLFNGPAGDQLGTDENSIPLSLGPIEFELGIIAGTKTVNPILSQFLENPNDGKVSVEQTKVEGMDDHIEVPHSHTFMMRASLVIEQSINFIQHGEFSQE
jgi:triacylglycerol lipase